MIKNNKLKFIISCVLILLPIVVGLLLWNDLPARMTTHWGGDGVADGTMSKAAAIFILPCVLLVLHVFLLFISGFDKRFKDQSKKIVGLTFWIMPALSILVNGVMYAIALDVELNVGLIVSLILGALFIVIGNYLPKTKRNCVYGIKLIWTMGNDENWTKTHRLGGILWVACGLVVMFSSLLPLEIGLFVIIGAALVGVIVPTLYSYTIYRRHKAEGIVYDCGESMKHAKAGKWITIIVLPILAVLFAVLMFYGDVSVTLGEDSFVIEASFASDLEVIYDEVESIELRDEFDIGSRTMGFGSPRLSTGTFENNEFGRYTLYAYTKAEAYVILKNGDDVLVIGGTEEDMRELYDGVMAKLGE
jgi:uncharacterized membrane protein